MADGIAQVLGEDDLDEQVADPFAGTPGFSADYKACTFTAKRFVLAGLAERAISVVRKTEVLPLLAHFLVEVAPGSIRMTATDLELSVLASSPSVTTEDSTIVALPARRLLAIIREAPEGDVTIAVAGDVATVTAGAASWQLRLVDAADYPPMPDVEGAELHSVSRAKFLEALRTVRYAVGRDGSRPALMLADITACDDGTAKVTACDSVRFARTTLPGFPVSMQVPAGAIDDLLRMLADTESEDIQIGDTGQHLVFCTGPSVFLAAKPTARFPDVEKLLLRPAMENTEELTVDKDGLAEAVRRVRINADPETSAIGLRIASGAVTVISKDKFGNGAEAAVAATWQGGDRLVVVNHVFLLDMMAAHPSATCVFRLGPDKAKRKPMVLLRDEETGVTGTICQMLAALVGYE